MDDGQEAFSRDWAEAQIVLTSQTISNLTEQHASLYKWILVSNLSINAGAAVALLGTSQIQNESKLVALACFFIGILSAIIAAILGQKSIEKGLGPNVKMLGLWVKLKNTGVYDKTRFEEIIGEGALTKSATKFGRNLSYLATVLFALGVIIAGDGLTSVSTLAPAPAANMSGMK